MDNSIFEKVEQIEKKYQELGVTLSDPNVIQDYEKFRDLSRQRKTMEETVEIYYKYKEAMETIKDSKEMLYVEKDASMKEFLNAEIATYKQLLEEGDKTIEARTSRWWIEQRARELGYIFDGDHIYKDGE